MKKLILLCWACEAPAQPRDTSAAEARMDNRKVLFIGFLPVFNCSRELRYCAKQYSSPLPPVATRSAWLQPRDWCEEFQDRAYSLSARPVRSIWPSIALPN